MSQKVYRLAVIGAGINGLCALYHAVRRSPGETVLLEQYLLGHDRGSSHGFTRATRCAYIDQDYVRLAQVAHDEAWPELECHLGRTLIHRYEVCFYGTEDSEYGQYAEAVRGAGVDVVEVTPDEARERYPQFRFENTAGVLIDRTGGVVAARETISGLIDNLRARSDIREQTAVIGIDIDSDPIRISTDRGELSAESVIVTAGPWVGRLFPQLCERLQVARQTVGYFELQDDSVNSSSGAFQSGLSSPATPSASTDYPSMAGPASKSPDTSSKAETTIPNSAHPDAIEDLRAFAATHFTAPVKRLVDTEFCHYTNTVNEDFILDHHPQNKRVVIGTGFSGHGFKFGPITGRILADLALDGGCSLPEFVSARQRFRLSRGGPS